MILAVWGKLSPDVSDYDPTDLEQQEADAALRQTTSELASENEDSDFVWLMSGPRGRRIVRRLLDHAGIFRSAWSTNAMQMAKHEGMKESGYWIISLIEQLCPEEYHTMMQEKKNARAVASNRS